MGNGSCQLDMTHSLAAYFRFRDFNAALFTYLALILRAFILTAMALPVLKRSENLFAEKTVPFGS